MKPLFTFLMLLLFTAFIPASAASAAMDVEQTVVQMPLEEGITMDDAVTSMKLRANLHNMMFVAHQPLHEQLQKMGHDSMRLEIFQFCDPVTARKMVDHNAIFAAYMPCRIAMVERPGAPPLLMMLNLEMLIQGGGLGPELNALAEEVNDKLTDILQAGAAGEL